MARNLMYIFWVCVLCCCAGQSGNSVAVSGGGNEASEAADSVSEVIDNQSDEEDNEEEEEHRLDTTYICSENDECSKKYCKIITNSKYFGEKKISDFTIHHVVYEYDHDFYDSISIYYENKLAFLRVHAYYYPIKPVFQKYLYDTNGILREKTTSHHFTDCEDTKDTIKYFDENGKLIKYDAYTADYYYYDDINTFSHQLTYKNLETDSAMVFRYVPCVYLFIKHYHGNELIDSVGYKEPGYDFWKVANTILDSLGKVYNDGLFEYWKDDEAARKGWGLPCMYCD